MINNDDAVKLLDSKRGDAVIIATMNANNVSFIRNFIGVSDNRWKPYLFVD